MLKPVQRLLIVALFLGGCAGAPPETSEVIVPSPSVEQAEPSLLPSSTPEPTAPTGSVVAPPALAPEAVVVNTTVVPGERIGDITRSTTRSDLAALVGEENLKDDEIDVGEGFTESGTVVSLGDRSFSVIWTDNSRTQPAFVRNLGSAWKTPEGIGVGTSFSELQQTLGEFQLYGFGWDYGGTVVLEGTSLAQYDGLLVLRVQPNADAPQSTDYQAVTGDALYSSNSDHFQSLNPKVNEMMVYLTPQN